MTKSATSQPETPVLHLQVKFKHCFVRAKLGQLYLRVIARLGIQHKHFTAFLDLPMLLVSCSDLHLLESFRKEASCRCNGLSDLQEDPSQRIQVPSRITPTKPRFHLKHFLCNPTQRSGCFGTWTLERGLLSKCWCSPPNSLMSRDNNRLTTTVLS